MMPAQTNALNQLPHHLYADGSATITTLIQVAGSAGTAIAITIYTTAMRTFGASHPNAEQEVVIVLWYPICLFLYCNIDSYRIYIIALR